VPNEEADSGVLEFPKTWLARLDRVRISSEYIRTRHRDGTRLLKTHVLFTRLAA
jgi:hypothetical protein